MVLQRDKEVPVWGIADPGETVVVKFAGQEKKSSLHLILLKKQENRTQPWSRSFQALQPKTP